MELPCKPINRGLLRWADPYSLNPVVRRALQPAFGQSFTVKDPGTLPGGIFSVARGIKDRGQVVGDALFCLKMGQWSTSAPFQVATRAKLRVSTTSAK